MFPSNFGITVATGFFFFILKINSELAHMFANIFLGFVVFSRCLPSIPPTPLIVALSLGTGGICLYGFAKYFYSAAAVMISRNQRMC